MTTIDGDSGRTESRALKVFHFFQVWSQTKELVFSIYLVTVLGVNSNSRDGKSNDKRSRKGKTIA